MDSLKAYHHKNIGLIGDAAHVFATFTSQGLNTAIEDGYILGNLLSDLSLNSTVQNAFEQFYQMRNDTAERHLNYGRNLKDQFLGATIQSDEMLVPVAL